MVGRSAGRPINNPAVTVLMNDDDMKYLDTHRHAIFHARLRYGWTRSLPYLATQDFTHEDYMKAAGERVAVALFMESGVDDCDYQAEA